MVLEGSCLCGGVKYRAEGPLQKMGRCHCTQCRKATGAEFATSGSVSADTFAIVQGRELLREYESSPNKFRVFCGTCGSPMFKRDRQNPSLVRLRLGTLDSALSQKPGFHIYVASKPAWSEIHDDVPQYEGALQ